jgi:hypothetical protein
MDMSTLSEVAYGDKDSLDRFLFENQLQHTLFHTSLFQQGLICPAYPLIDVETDNFDDWLQSHQVEHQFMANALNLSNPFNMLDADFRKEADFYDWLNNHYVTHTEIAATLGLS